MPIPTPALALPPGLVGVRPTAADLDDVHALITGTDLAILGRIKTGLDDTRDHLLDPELDLAHDAWLVRRGTSAGPLAGYGTVRRRGQTAVVDLDPWTDPADPEAARIGAALIDALEHRATQLLAGAPAVDVHVGMLAGDPVHPPLLADRGYAVATRYVTMRLELPRTDADEPAALAPAGARIRHLDPRAVGFETDLQAMHEVYEAGFAAHFAHTPRSFDAWRALLEAASDVDLSQLWLAEVVAHDQPRPVGMLLASDRYLETENAGYVRNLAVLPEARGRGLARALLHAAFAEFTRRGRQAALLHVDTNNVTSALRLYESVGMRPTVEIDVWRRTLPAQPS